MNISRALAPSVILGGAALWITSAASPARGPLRVHPDSPRYFTDGSGKAVYLTGSHTWNSLQDRGLSQNPPFDFTAYLEFLRKHHHNFIRLWAWEGGCSSEGEASRLLYEPMPWLRTGPGMALDGKLKYDLAKFNPAYFKRLRERVTAAGKRGIYVSIMLFQGWSIERKKNFRESPWFSHPFNKANNINGIAGDANGNDDGEEVHTLAVPAVTRQQEAYVRKCVDTVSDLDNVLYEITNESPAFTKEWQYHIIRYLKDYEAGKPKRHPVGMTYFYAGGPGTMDALFNSPADWISPGNEGTVFRYHDDPPAAGGRKVILSDTDHFFGVGGDQKWVWKSFLRGLNPIFMDPLNQRSDQDLKNTIEDAKHEPARRAMGHTLTLASRMNLAAMTPQNGLASTGYCLADPGKEYLVYLPDGGEVKVDLTANQGMLAVEWIHPVEGTVTPGKAASGGNNSIFKAPFDGDAVLHLRMK